MELSVKLPLGIRSSASLFLTDEVGSEIGGFKELSVWEPGRGARETKGAALSCIEVMKLLGRGSASVQKQKSFRIPSHLDT